MACGTRYCKVSRRGGTKNLWRNLTTQQQTQTISVVSGQRNGVELYQGKAHRWPVCGCSYSESLTIRYLKVTQIQHLTPSRMTTSGNRGGGGGLAAKSTGCSCKGPTFSCSHPPVTLPPGESLWRKRQEEDICTYMHTLQYT